VSEPGRVSIVTGVSRGLGEALVAQLLAGGDRVMGIGRHFTAEQRRFAAAEPDRLVLREADLAAPATLPDRPALEALLAGADHAALIHNAAMVEPIGAIGTLPPDQVATAVTVNLTAPMLLTNAFLAALPPAIPATILFVSSGAARRMIDGWATYSATKRGGEAFFESLASQLADHTGVRVASVNPGVMDTGMQASVRRAAGGPDWFPEGDRYVSLHEQGRLPDPAEIARQILAEHLPEVTVR
jgi:NAD(P)-dependent dehydrogenase (short-subunit alcohol dehydrogenase family)